MVMQYIASRYVFSTGFRFYYWRSYKGEDNTKQHQNNRFDHGGYLPCDLYIAAKYNSLKEELLNNNLFSIDS